MFKDKHIFKNYSILLFFLIFIFFCLKDRVVFHRLEHICYTIENGEWPFARRQPPPQFFPPTAFDSRSGTPVGSSVTKSDQSVVDSDAGDSATDPQQVMRGDSEKDFEVLYSEVGIRRCSAAAAVAGLLARNHPARVASL